MKRSPWEALYRASLALLPEKLRCDFADDMVTVFAERLRGARGVRARVRLIVGSVVDVVRVASAERVGARGPNARSPRWLFRDLFTEVRLAARSLVRTPVFTIAAGLTLAIGIGTATALFSVVNGVLLEPLPYRDADRLVLVGSPYLDVDNLRQWREALSVVEFMSPIAISGRTAGTPAGAAAVRVMPVGADLFEMLGTDAIRGRLLRTTDDLPNAAPVAVVSDRFAREHYGGDPVGKTLTVAERSYEVVGTLPATFALRYRDIDAWLPWQHADPGGASFIAKLQEGVDLDEARVRLGALAESRATPEQRADAEEDAVTLYSVRELTLGDSESRIWMLFGAALLVLLLAAANVATLSIGRAVARREEMAVRAALGAGQGRIVRQLIVESCVLAVLGSVVGLLIAFALPSFIALQPDVLPRAEEIRVDLWVLLFALGAGVLTVTLFGVAPAIVMSRRTTQTSLRAATTRGKRTGIAQHALVVGEVAAAFVLAIGALLLLQTYVALRPTAPGFQVQDRVVAELDLPRERYLNDERSHRFAMDVLEAARSLPGSPRAELATHLPLTGETMINSARGEAGRPASEVHFRAVSHGYLDLMEMPVIRGRGLLPTDRPGAPPVVVVNETAARDLWNSTDAVGRKATLDFGGAQIDFEVVGVVRDSWLFQGPDTGLELFVSFDQLPYAFFNVVIESTPERPVGLADVRAIVGSIDPDVPIRVFAELEDLAAETVADQRFLAMLLGVLTLIGIVLAGTGCFAVLMQQVGQRTRELGVRLTMGASARSVAGLVLRRALGLAAIGTVFGVALAVFATRVLESQLYGVDRTDPITFIGAAVGMLIVALMAATIPAARVARLDPIEAMRVHQGT